MKSYPTVKNHDINLSYPIRSIHFPRPVPIEFLDPLSVIVPHEGLQWPPWSPDVMGICNMCQVTLGSYTQIESYQQSLQDNIPKHRDKILWFSLHLSSNLTVWPHQNARIRSSQIHPPYMCGFSQGLHTHTHMKSASTSSCPPKWPVHHHVNPKTAAAWTLSLL